MATAYSSSAQRPSYDRGARKGRRSSMSLPALVHLLGRQYNARVHNLSCGGAMIECDAPVRDGDPISISCGAIETVGKTVWVKPGRFGLQFINPLDEEQIQRQLSRSDAIATRRDLRDLDPRR